MTISTVLRESIFYLVLLGVAYFVYSSYFKKEMPTTPISPEPIAETTHATTEKSMTTESTPPLPTPDHGVEGESEEEEEQEEEQIVINQLNVSNATTGTAENDHATTTVEESSPSGYRCFWGVKAGVTESDPIYVAYLDNSNKVFRYESRIPLDMSYPRQGTSYELTDFLPKNSGQYSSVKIYKWNTTSNRGQYKIETTDEPILEEDLDYLEDLKGDPDYTCVPWDIDTQLLTPPANITFTEKSSL